VSTNLAYRAYRHKPIASICVMPSHVSGRGSISQVPGPVIAMRCHMNRGFDCRRGRRQTFPICAGKQSTPTECAFEASSFTSQLCSRPNVWHSVPPRASFTHLHQVEFVSPLTLPLGMFWFAVEYCKLIRDYQINCSINQTKAP
jgi:hypothetical protein